MVRQGIILGLVLGAAFLAGCSGEPSSGPVAVKWDRDQCERCRMVLSDPFHAAQVRQPVAEGRTKIHLFDDFGCAVIWLDDQEWRDQPGVEFWVPDHRSGEWIDARTAFYVQGQVTPMEYGLGAQREQGENGGMDYAQAHQHVYEINRRFNAHHHLGGGVGSPNLEEGARSR